MHAYRTGKLVEGVDLEWGRQSVGIEGPGRCKEGSRLARSLAPWRLLVTIMMVYLRLLVHYQSGALPCYPGRVRRRTTFPRNEVIRPCTEAHQWRTHLGVLLSNRRRGRCNWTKCDIAQECGSGCPSSIEWVGFCPGRRDENCASACVPTPQNSLWARTATPTKLVSYRPLSIV